MDGYTRNHAPNTQTGSLRAGVPYQERAVSLQLHSWVKWHERATKWKPSTRTRTRGEAVDSGDDMGPRTQVEVEVKWT